MFGKKRASLGPRRIRILSADGSMFDDVITALKLPESLIIELSIEFFDDPEPCQIHRGAVMRRVFMELESVLTEGKVTPGGELPEVALKYLVSYCPIREATLYREGA